MGKVFGVGLVVVLVASTFSGLVQTTSAAKFNIGDTIKATGNRDEKASSNNTNITSGEIITEATNETLNTSVPFRTVSAPKQGILLQAGWTTIMTEDFEGAFPGSKWTLYGDPTWDDDDYKPHTGGWSGWCAGSAYDPEFYYYPNNMNAWMVYGPFDLSDATDAELNFYDWLKTEANYDYFKYLASIDGGTWYYGWQVSGNSGGWEYRSFDLTNVPTLGNLCGQPEVWIAFLFTSDGSITDQGVFIDDVELRKYVAADSNPPTVDAFSVAPPSHSVTLGNAFTISYTVSDTGGSGLKNVQLWRNSTTEAWAQIDVTSLTGVGNGPYSGSFSDAPSAVERHSGHLICSPIPNACIYLCMYYTKLRSEFQRRPNIWLEFDCTFYRIVQLGCAPRDQTELLQNLSLLYVLGKVSLLAH